MSEPLRKRATSKAMPVDCARVVQRAMPVDYVKVMPVDYAKVVQKVMPVDCVKAEHPLSLPYWSRKE